VVANDLNTEWCSYLARIMNILKNGNLSNELKVFVTDYGQNMLKEIESKSLNEEKDVIESYLSLRNFFITELDSENIFSETDSNNKTLTKLERCELKNGKIYWLCDEHIKMKNARILTDSVKAAEVSYDQTKYQMLDEIN
jgi:hypothetical protein